MLRRWRLSTGLFMLFFVAWHLANHMVGLLGPEALTAANRVFKAIWVNTPAQVLLASVTLTHMLLGLWAFYRRKDLRKLRFSEIAQLSLALLIPPLLVIHILGTVYAYAAYGVNAGYNYILLLYFVFDPWSGVRQALVLLIAWSHGGLGLWFWLRLKPKFERWRDLLLSVLLLYPLLALAGVMAAGSQIMHLAKQPAWLNARIAEINPPGEAAVEAIYRLEEQLLIGYGAVLALVLLARWLRYLLRDRSGLVKITYPDARVVSVPAGTTILEASQLNAIPHASVCGGRGRCSTCRVRLLHGAAYLPTPKAEERRVLRNVNAPPDVRLACQSQPFGPIEVEPLLAPGVGPKEAGRRPAPRPGEERTIAVLFADIRGFTSISEAMLPYDVVFLLNRYFRAIALALEEAGGHVDKFIGDGVMALFGLDGAPEEACRQALAAAAAMSLAVEDINRALGKDLAEPLRIGIGIHVGTAVVGEMGYGRARALTAIGDTVNTASRLEQLTKEHKAILVISQEVATLAGADFPQARAASTAIRGRKEPLSILTFKTLEDLPLPDGAGVASAGTPKA
ncbi:MAG: adenylate/guanylate cyclase domain-containing protein [Rhodospirillales bacterium]